MNDFEKQFGALLKRCRAEQEWPLKRVAYEMGVSVSVVSDWERGKRFPSKDNIKRLAELYRLPVCRLFCIGADLCTQHTPGCPLCTMLAADPLPVIPQIVE